MKRVAFASLVVFFALFGREASAQSSAPKLLPFQGRLSDQNGLAVSNSVRLVQFKIFNVPTGGNPVWAGELHRTTVNGGLVNVMLGTKTPLTGVDFDRQLYLEITVDVSGPSGQPDNAITAADPPMLPRQAILPVVFAKESANSRLLDGYNWSDLFGTNNPENGTLLDSKIREGSISAGKLSGGIVASNQIAPQTVNASLLASGSIDISKLAQQVAEALVPVGTIIAFAGDTNAIPAGWLLCDGRPVINTTYPSLRVAIGDAWGAGVRNNDGSLSPYVNGGAFNLPDLRGVFLRGVNGSRTGTFSDTDTSARMRVFPDGGGNVGNSVGSLQVDDLKSHDHELRRNSIPMGTAPGSYDPLQSLAKSAPYFVTRTENTGGNETRPKNAYVLYIIKY